MEPGGLRTHYVFQAGLKLTEILQLCLLGAEIKSINPHIWLIMVFQT